MHVQRWVPISEYHPGMSLGMHAGMIDGPQLDMLHLEAALQEADIPCVFDPRRPGDTFARHIAVVPSPIRLMVREIDLQRAERLKQDLSQAESHPSSASYDADDGCER